MVGLTSSIGGLLISAALGGVGLPFGVPPAPEDPMMGRVAPEKCLFYLSWAGTASPDPKSPNQTEQLLAEPEVQEFLKQMGAAFRGTVVKNARANTASVPGALPDNPLVPWLSVEATYDVLRCVSTNPGAVFVTRAKGHKPPGSPASPSDAESATPKGVPADKDGKDALGVRLAAELEWGEVFSLGRDAAALAARLRTSAEQSGKNTKDIVVLHDGAWYYRPEAKYVFGVSDGYLVMASGETTWKEIVARMKNEPPRWWTDIGKQLPIERRSVTVYLDLRAARDLLASARAVLSPEQARAILELFGLGNARTWIEVWGLEGRDFANKSLVVLDGAPQGLLGVLTDRPLRPEDAATIPSDATFGVALRFDPQKAMDTVLAALEKMEPQAKAKAMRQLDQWERAIAVDLRHGTLKSMGDTWCVYGSPSEGNFFLTGLTAVVPLKDWAGMNVAYGRLMGAAKRWKPSRDDVVVRPWQEQVATVASYRFADNDIYCLGSDDFSLGGYGYFWPSWCMTKREMIFALSPQNVKAYLSRDDRHEPLNRRPEVAELFAHENGPTMIAYGDGPHAFEMFYPILNIASLAQFAMSESGMENGRFIMPSCLSIRRHLGPTTATLQRTKYGVEFVSRGTIPLPSATVLFGWTAGTLWFAEAEPPPTPAAAKPGHTSAPPAIFDPYAPAKGKENPQPQQTAQPTQGKRGN